MCGIIGFITNASNGLFNNERDAVEAALVTNNLRGSDSTGVALIDNKQLGSVVKSMGTAWDLFSTQEYKDLRSKMFSSGKAIIGHGRAATRGDKIIENAHPFVIEEGNRYFALVHNGTIPNYNQPWDDMKDFTVDSAWLADKIFRYGPEEALAKIDGPMALLWWDNKEKAVFAYRNHERPLAIAFTSNNGVMFNSEGVALKWLNNRFGLKIEDKQFFVVKERTLHKFPINDPAAYTTEDIKRIYTYKPPAHFNNGHRGQYYENNAALYPGPDDDAAWENWVKDNRTSAAQDAAAARQDCDVVQHRSVADIRQRRSLRAVAENETEVEVFGKDVVWMKDKPDIIRDYLKLFDGRLDSITFTAENGKVVKHQSGSISYDKVVPYLPNLVKVEHIKKGELKETYKETTDQGTPVTRYRYHDYDTSFRAKVILLMPPQNSPLGEVKPVSVAGGRRAKNEKPQYAAQVNIKNKRGKRLHWHTLKSIGANRKAVKHEALVSAYKDDHFDVYSNDHDGTFMVGQRIALEAFNVEERGIGPNGKTVLLVNAVLLAEEQSWSPVDIIARVYDMSKEQVLTHGVLSGLITFMRLMTREEHKKTGGYVEIEVRAVKGISEISEDEAAEINAMKAITFNRAVTVIESKGVTKKVSVDAEDE